jgi:hypothetical protein
MGDPEEKKFKLSFIKNETTINKTHKFETRMNINGRTKLDKRVKMKLGKNRKTKIKVLSYHPHPYSQP